MHVAIVLRTRFWTSFRCVRRCRRESNDLGAWLAILLLLCTSIPVESDTVVACLALPCTIQARRFLFSARNRRSATSMSIKPQSTYHFTLRDLHGLRDCQHTDMWHFSRRAHQQPFRDLFLTSFPSNSGFLGRGIWHSRSGHADYRRRCSMMRVLLSLE